LQHRQFSLRVAPFIFLSQVAQVGFFFSALSWVLFVAPSDRENERLDEQLMKRT
jgi:hypothetical protein